jgi:hypothetical protein
MTPDTSHLVWKVAHKVKETKLHDQNPHREGNNTANAVKNLPCSGGATLEHATVATFNRSVQAFVFGIDTLQEADELEPPDFSFESSETAELNYTDE